MTLILNGTTGASAVQPGSIQTDDLAPLAVTAPKMAGNQSGTAPVYGARAWVNFDATRNAAGVTDALLTARFIRGSGNVSSVVKTATGVYLVTFTSALPDANYAVTGTVYQSGGVLLIRQDATVSVPTTSTTAIAAFNASGAAVDATHNHIVVFG